MSIDWSVLEDPEMIARIVLQVVLLAASAVFSMSETTLFSLRDSDLRRIEAKSEAQGARLRDLLNEPRQLIVSILCGNELINIAATVNLAGIMLALFGNPGAAAIANALIMVPLLLIFCEITPKTLAVTAPETFATRLIEPMMTVWVKVVMPLRVAVRAVADRVTTLFVGDAERAENILSTDEFAVFLRDIEQEGVVTRTERRLILNLIHAGGMPVADIMVPRPQVQFIDADLTPVEIIARFRTLRHRRVPVYRGMRDNVLGVLKENTVLRVVGEKAVGDITLGDLIEPAKLVPATQTVGELAEFFADGDHHAAIVVNEFGGVEGLVSADDVFGYLTQGRSVYLDARARISDLGEGAFGCTGLTPLKSLRKTSRLPLEETEGVSTVGGLIMALLRRVPEPGDEVRDAGVVLRVVSMKNLLVDEVLIAPEGHAVLDWDTGGEDRAREHGGGELARGGDAA